MLDQKIMQGSFGGNTDFVRDTMRIYLRNAPALAEDALGAIRQGDNAGLATSAHALKGITAYFTRRELYELCLELEHMGRDNALPLQSVHALGRWSRMNSELKELITAMEAYLAEE